MWDNGICEHYGYYHNSVGYGLFLQKMQVIAKLVIVNKKYNKQQLGITIPKLIDEYNWAKFSTAKMNKLKQSAGKASSRGKVR